MKDLFPCYTAVLLFDPSTVVVEGSGKNKPQYRTEQRAPTDEDFERHLKGDVSLGLSPLCEDNTVRWGAIDVDLYGDGDTEQQIRRAVQGHYCAVFRTKSNGYHIYMFTDDPVPATQMVTVLKALRTRLPKKIREHAKEIFPKQTSVEDIAKNPSLINLPMFGNERPLAFIAVGNKVATPNIIHSAHGETGTFIKNNCSVERDKWKIVYERAKEITKARPIDSSLDYREPDPAVVAGRHDYLLRVGASLRARGANVEEISDTLHDLNKTLPGKHPVFDEPLPDREIEQILKSLSKYEQGTPSGLTYQKVAEFNEEFALINFDGKIEVINKAACDFSTWPWGEFVKWVKPRRVKIGNKYIELAPLWLADIDRHQYDELVIEPTTYSGRAYNVFRGFDVEPMPGDASLFFDVYIRDILCSGDTGLARWVTHYLADMVQRPTEPSPPTAIAMRGGQGQGKTFLFRFMKAIMGRSAIEIASTDRLFSRFNRRLVGVALIGAEEAIFSGDPRLAQQLKTLISSDRWTYEEKFKATIEAKNVHRLIATTNSKHAVLVEDDDRRWTVIEVPTRWDLSTEEGREKNSKDWEPLYQFMRSDGPAIVLDALFKIEVDEKLIRFGHVNASKADDKIMSDPVLAWLDEVAETGCLPHDLDANGVASISSVTEAVKAIGGYSARGLTNEKISQAVSQIVDATKCRTGIFVDRSQADQEGMVSYLTKKHQRGLSFGSLRRFRERVAKVTHRQYPDDDRWQRWSINVRLPSGDDPAELAANMERIMADRPSPMN